MRKQWEDELAADKSKTKENAARIDGTIPRRAHVELKVSVTEKRKEVEEWKQVCAEFEFVLGKMMSDKKIANTLENVTRK